VPVYLLIPLHTDHPVWQVATRLQPLQVIAKSEQEARARASRRFGPASKGVSMDPAADPWLHPRWVYAHIVDDADPKMLTLTEND
jgi:hypothetical protein